MLLQQRPQPAYLLPQRVVLLGQETAMVVQRCAMLLDLTKASLLRDEFRANRWKLLT